MTAEEAEKLAEMLGYIAHENPYWNVYTIDAARFAAVEAATAILAKHGDTYDKD